MARKTQDVVIGPDGGRDAGKHFVAYEMSAKQAERWADRAFLALAHASIDLPPGIERAGMVGIAEIARLVGNIQFPELSPLMDELIGCVRVRSDPAHPQYERALVDTGQLEGDDIEEVRTRQLLRQVVMGLHINFSLAAVILSLIAAASELKTIPITQIQSTSRRRSRSSSPAS